MILLGTLRSGVSAACLSLMLAGVALAEPPQSPPAATPSSEDEIRAALFAGVPGGAWKEGLLFEGIRPSPWMSSASNWFPRTEEGESEGEVGRPLRRR